MNYIAIARLTLFLSFFSFSFSQERYSIDIDRSGLHWYAYKVTGEHNGNVDVSNGYVIDVNVESKGLLIVNLPYTKWWKAVALDQELLVEPGNFFQTVIDVPEGNYRIILEYMRPKLTDKIFPALFAWSQ